MRHIKKSKLIVVGLFSGLMLALSASPAKAADIRIGVGFDLGHHHDYYNRYHHAPVISYGYYRHQDHHSNKHWKHHKKHSKHWKHHKKHSYYNDRHHRNYGNWSYKRDYRHHDGDYGKRAYYRDKRDYDRHSGYRSYRH